MYFFVTAIFKKTVGVSKYKVEVENENIWSQLFYLLIAYHLLINQKSKICVVFNEKVKFKLVKRILNSI